MKTRIRSQTLLSAIYRMAGEGQDPTDPAGRLSSYLRHGAERLEASQYPGQAAGPLHVRVHSTQGTGAMQAGPSFPEGPFKIAGYLPLLLLTQNSLPTTLHQVSTDHPVFFTSAVRPKSSHVMGNCSLASSC